MGRKIGYWVPTGLIAAMYAMGGVLDVVQPKAMAADVAELGYPSYFFRYLGVWKLLAVPALLAPGFPRLKEWAYAGIFINLGGASLAHYMHDDPIAKVATPLVLIALLVTSWALRPADRKLPGPLV